MPSINTQKLLEKVEKRLLIDGTWRDGSTGGDL